MEEVGRSRIGPLLEHEWVAARKVEFEGAFYPEADFVQAVLGCDRRDFANKNRLRSLEQVPRREPDTVRRVGAGGTQEDPRSAATARVSRHYSDAAIRRTDFGKIVNSKPLSDPVR
jgi:hypothetical protein